METQNKAQKALKNIKKMEKLLVKLNGLKKETLELMQDVDKHSFSQSRNIRDEAERKGINIFKESF